MYNRILIQVEATQLPEKSLHQKFNYSLLFKTMGDMYSKPDTSVEISLFWLIFAEIGRKVEWFCRIRIEQKMANQAG